MDLDELLGRVTRANDTPQMKSKREKLNELISKAKRDECSDLHITVGTAIARRRFGELEILPNDMDAAETEEMILSALSDKQKEKVEAGEDLDCAIYMEDGTRLRVNVYHQRNNLAATFRLLRDSIPTFDQIGLPKAVRQLVDAPRGLVLITGPTGSGKTTTLATMIDYINKQRARHVITIEDPIEYIYPHAKSMIHQRELGKDTASFAGALHSALREDPDIIMVGEMRDYETTNAVITAAETGHLVFSTMHTTTAAQTIERIIDTYPLEGQNQLRSQLANVLQGIQTQVLVPREDGAGMVMATEVLINTEAVANQIRDNKTYQITSTIQAGVSQGMHTMNADLKRLEREMVISHETALKYATSVKELEGIR